MDPPAWQRPGSRGRSSSPVPHGCASVTPPYRTAVPAQPPATHRNRPVRSAQPCPAVAPAARVEMAEHSGEPSAGRAIAKELPHRCPPAGPLLFRLFLSSLCSRAAVEGATWCPWSRGTRQSSALVSCRGSLQVSCLLPPPQLSGLHTAVAPLGLEFPSNSTTVGRPTPAPDPRAKPAQCRCSHLQLE